MKSMKTLVSVIALLALPVFLACGGGGGGSTQPQPQPTVITVNLAPMTASLTTGGTQSFTATVTGSSNTAVTWSVQEGTAGGTITAVGLYTAPATAGTFHVVATSVVDTSKSSMATVTVTVPPVAVTVSPATVNLLIGGTQTFTAAVTNATNTAVTWSVQEGTAGGTVSSAGLYTAPGAIGTYHVVATSVADTSKSATATVTVALPAATGLSYIDPSSSSYKLVKNTTLSSGAHLVLDLIGPATGTGMGVSLTLTGDTHTSWTNVSASDPANTLMQNGALFNLGTGTPIMKAKVVGSVLQATVAQKAPTAAASLSGVLLRVALDLNASQNLPQGTALTLISDATKCELLDGTGAISTITVSVGTLTAQ